MTGGERPIGDDDLHAYVDGQIPPERRAAIEAYLASHPAAAADVAVDAEVMALLRVRLAAKVEEPIPPRLRVTNILEARRRRLRGRLRTSVAAAALLAIGAGGGWYGNSAVHDRLVAQNSASETTTRDAIAAYRIFVVEKLHPVEVRADQEAHLVQWLSRRLGQKLSAPDLSEEGYELMGGRLLPAGNDPAAMFMYADANGNRLALYARTDGSTDATGFQFERHDGVSAFAWVDRDLCYVVTAAIDRPHLLAVAEAVYRKLSKLR